MDWKKKGGEGKGRGEGEGSGGKGRGPPFIDPRYAPVGVGLVLKFAVR